MAPRSILQYYHTLSFLAPEYAITRSMNRRDMTTFRRRQEPVLAPVCTRSLSLVKAVSSESIEPGKLGRRCGLGNCAIQ
jgi:hypothetical protein